MQLCGRDQMDLQLGGWYTFVLLKADCACQQSWGGVICLTRTEMGLAFSRRHLVKYQTAATMYPGMMAPRSWRS